MLVMDSDPSWNWDVSLTSDPNNSSNCSKRAFQSQFRKWGFPLKQNPVYRNDELLTRVRELWEQNLPQKEMLRILGEEGFDIKQRELVRLRSRNRLLLRDPRGDKAQGLGSPGRPVELSSNESRPSSRGSSAVEPVGTVSSPDPTASCGDEQISNLSQDAVSSLFPKPGRKSRRRTRRWAGQPADPTARPPRFPSETTLDEARLILGLDSVGYRAVRTTFQRICEECGVVKKTLAGRERWESVKGQLVHEVVQLQTPMWGSQENMEPKKLALDIICTDVTKRMRDGDKRMTVSDAKRILAINPEESRQLRSTFYQLLVSREEQFTCKSKAGPEQWNKLILQWMEGSDLIHRLLPEDTSTPEHQERRKALDILASDVMKRLRDEKARKESSKRNRASTVREAASDSNARSDAAETPPTPLHHTPSSSHSFPASSPSTFCAAGEQISHAINDYDDVSPISQMQLVPSSPNNSMHVPIPVGLQPQDPGLHGPVDDELTHSGHGHHRLLSGVLDTDGSVALDSRLSTQLLLAHSPQASFVEPHFIPPFSVGPGGQVFHQVAATAATPIAIYLRLHPSSTYRVASGLWIATLSTHSVEELRLAAAEKYPEAMCVRIEGVLKDLKGSELPLQIDDDGQLGAYLAHLEGATPTFNVQLAWRG
ncbi:hypothetical protein jhhlp_005217 [Lomentospora prolificans]|uniref:Clr5 domain-containing protein n=1 Tax=Lomentospora prolificans TaxID=41688 RepID=A0A2N3N794_9PEZI|nr:hypothetical protein jhhlp_005217 [Lomentospora prolificans]